MSRGEYSDSESLAERKRDSARRYPCTVADVEALVRSLRGVDYLPEPRMSEAQALDLIERFAWIGAAAAVGAWLYEGWHRENPGAIGEK